ncbi:MAG TPA: TorF family putative porin [Steroidobacteraceae bacterium]|nr:TorF family putative porin [Steroidobacteraceae bacterium]
MRSHIAIAAGLLLATGVAHAQLTGTVTAVNDYDFRGISLSGTDPALQGSIDWAHDSGFYAGLWASSSLDFGPGTDADWETDAYFGITGGDAEKSFGWSAGFVYYYYWPDGDDVQYPEIYVGGNFRSFGAKLWYTNDYGNLNTDAWYFEGNFDHDLPANFSVHLHLGYNFGDYWKDSAYGENFDYSVGVGYALGNFNLLLKWVDNDADFTERGDAFNNEGRVIFSISTTFPWEKGS